jgi:hypothetical protein
MASESAGEVDAEFADGQIGERLGGHGEFDRH